MKPRKPYPTDLADEQWQLLKPSYHQTSPEDENGVSICAR